MNLTKEIPEWLDNYLTENNLKTFVVGISGGIDSALTSTLCALTGKPTIVVSLPINQGYEQLKRANNHQNWLKTNFSNVVVMEKNLSLMIGDFQRMFDKPDPLAMANTRSRLRMMMLYYIAQTNNGLVVGTGNKVEDFGVGFFTKWGDGGVDISPIGDLTKTEVRELAKELGIIDEIIQAPPTDGLWEDGRTDEDQLGATYEELEWAMSYEPKPNDFLTNRQNEVLTIYNKFHKLNKHKMQPIPVFKK